MSINRNLILGTLFAASLAYGSVAYSQGRHDDKPHGQGKAAPAVDPAKDNTTRHGGRHHEMGHPNKKMSKKADTTPGRSAEKNGN